jgi:hypothetical protein
MLGVTELDRQFGRQRRGVGLPGRLLRVPVVAAAAGDESHGADDEDPSGPHGYTLRICYAG